AFAVKYDADHPERPFLPPDLFRNDGPWAEVEADNGSTVIAARHVFDFSGRSAFRVFLRFPEGRQATLDYFMTLHDFPKPSVMSRARGGKVETLGLSQGLPQFPVGTQTALVRQLLLVDREGRITATPLTESVQLRVFTTIAPAAAAEQQF